MGSISITQESEIRTVLERVCRDAELAFLVTPYMRFETNFLGADAESIHVRITMTAEESTFGLRSEDLRIRFADQGRFLEGRTKLLGFGMLEGRRTLRLAIPKSLQNEEQRKAYRVVRLGAVDVTFSTPKYDLRSGRLADISTTGAKLYSPQDALEPILKAGDPIAVSISLTEEVRINSPAVVRWVNGRSVGLEFTPSLEPNVITPLSRWVFQKREEEKTRLETSPTVVLTPAAPERSLLLVSSSDELEGKLRSLLVEIPVVRRAAPTMSALKTALLKSPSLVCFHLSNLGLDEKKRLKALVEQLPSRMPFLLLGTGVETTSLFDLGLELKAAAVYDLGTSPGPFFQRLVQGIIRRHVSGIESSMGS